MQTEDKYSHYDDADEVIRALGVDLPGDSATAYPLSLRRLLLGLFSSWYTGHLLRFFQTQESMTPRRQRPLDVEHVCRPIELDFCLDPSTAVGGAIQPSCAALDIDTIGLEAAVKKVKRLQAAESLLCPVRFLRLCARTNWRSRSPPGSRLAGGHCGRPWEPFQKGVRVVL